MAVDRNRSSAVDEVVEREVKRCIEARIKSAIREGERLHTAKSSVL